MKTLSKRIFAVVLTLAMTLTLTTWASAADFTDMPDNWAKAPLEAAVENGLLNGSDGLLHPTDYLTRAEMAAILVRAFGTTQSASVSGFSDVKADAWYVTQNAVPGAVFMEIMNGNNNGTFEPGRNISREQAFAVLARALKLEAGSSSVLAQFTDAAQISGWASGEVAAMVAAGYVNGSNGKLNPKGNITRQEFAQVMFNIFGDYISTAGTVTELGGKAVMINVPGVTVKDTTVHGDVIIGEGVGEGDVFFENVTIEGRVVVRGGGVNSIHFINSDSSQVLVSKIAGPVRIVADNASSVAEVAVIGGTDTVTVQGSVAKVAVEGDAPVVVKDATVGTVEVSSTAKVELDNAKVTTVAVNASNASVALTNGAAVATVDVAATAAGSTVTGEQGTTITTVKSDVSVTVAGDVKVNKTEGTGSVTDANGDVIATTPSTPSYPIGGGSTGGNKPSTPDDSTSGSTGTPDEDNRGDVEDSAGTPSTPTVPGSGEIADENITGGNADDCKDGHTWGEAQTTTAATCTVDGIGTYTCGVCGAKGTVTITKTGHSLTKITVTKQPTCSAVGKKTVACANPGCTQSSVEDIAVLEHDFTADNRKGYDENGHYNLCKYCDAKGTSSAHTLTYDTKTAEKHTGKCVCGYTKSDAHTFGEAQTSKEPNCTEKGSKTSTCSICKYEKVEEIAIDSTKHDWSNKDGVCKNNSAHKCDHGSTAPGATCGTCGATLPAATPDPEPVEHTHDYQYQASQDGSKCVGTCASQVGTCTEKTVEKTHTANQKCDFCGTTYTPDTTEGDGQGDGT